MQDKGAAMNATQSAKEIFIREGYESFENFIHDSALLISLSKIDQYEAECDFYKEKYQMGLEKFEAALHKKRGKENFQKEEDLEDWEFARHAIRWWKERADELRTSKTH